MYANNSFLPGEWGMVKTKFKHSHFMPLTKTLEAKIRYQYATFITLETYSDRRMHPLLDLRMTERTHSAC